MTTNRTSRLYGSRPDPRRRGATSGRSGAKRYGEQLRDDEDPRTKEEDPSPSASVVEKFHRNADTDVRAESLHHTLGPGETQAAPGRHTHDGGTSPLILEGYQLTGSKGNPATMWPSIINCLTRLGATDNTTP